MTTKKERKSFGLSPIDPQTALGIQSKAVFKYTHFQVLKHYLIASPRLTSNPNWCNPGLFGLVEDFLGKEGVCR